MCVYFFCSFLLVRPPFSVNLISQFFHIFPAAASVITTDVTVIIIITYDNTPYGFMFRVILAVAIKVN